MRRPEGPGAAAHRVVNRRGVRLHRAGPAAGALARPEPPTPGWMDGPLDPNLAPEQLRREVSSVAILHRHRRRSTTARPETLVTDAVHGRRAAPIAELVHAVLDEDVVGLDVQVGDVPRVRAGQRGGHLPEHSRDLPLAEARVIRFPLRSHVFGVLPRRLCQRYRPLLHRREGVVAELELHEEVLAVPVPFRPRAVVPHDVFEPRRGGRARQRRHRLHLA